MGDGGCNHETHPVVVTSATMFIEDSSKRDQQEKIVSGVDYSTYRDFAHLLGGA